MPQYVIADDNVAVLHVLFLFGFPGWRYRRFAVGTQLLRPPHRSERAQLGTRLLPWVVNGKPSGCPYAVRRL